MNPMNEEKLRILKMVEERKITAEEAARLLEALESSGTPEHPASPGRMLRIRVTDLRTGKSRVNVSIPLKLVNIGLSLGARFSPKIEGLDWDELWQTIKSGAQGKLADVEDLEEGERVEIFVD